MRLRIAAAIIVAAVLAPGIRANPCEKAEQDRAAKNLAGARAKYIELIRSATLLQQPALADCAEKGLLAVSEGPDAQQRARADITLAKAGNRREFDIARRLLQLGRREEAAKVLDEVIKADPAVRIPAGLRLDPYAVATRLKEAGFHADAETAVKDAAKSGRAIPSELATVDTGAWGRFKRWLLAWSDLIALIAILVLTGGTIRYVIMLRREPRLEIAEFLPAENSVPTQHSASVTAMVREALGRFAPDEPKYSIATVRETIAPLEIPDAILGAIPAPLSPLARIFPEVLQRLARARIIALDGRVHAPGAHGTGLTLSLTYERVTLGSITLWQGDFEPATIRTKKAADQYGAADYYALAEPAAIWLLFQLEKVEGRA